MIRRALIYCFVICFILIKNNLYAQTSNYRSYSIAYTSDTLLIDTLSINRKSFKVVCGTLELQDDVYYLDAISAKLKLFTTCSDSLRLEYRVFDMMFDGEFKRKDTTLIFKNNLEQRNSFLYSAVNKRTDFFGSSIQKSGSISRGISFGNNQDLSVNSSLNLQLAGDIAPNLKLLASVSDDNIPIQPDGNTNKLQEFDQIFIQIYNEKFKVIAGDFWLENPTGHFLTYRKRAQGLFSQYAFSNKENTNWIIQGAGALSKGKFARNVIQGTESNQGPYRLRGNENEPFIIVLGGTERVYLDGKLLERGQEYDYTINYNTSEVTFTTRNLITKDSRVVVEFQYSDQNYARSLFQASANYKSDKLDYWFNVYSEQDAKNQSLQQDLSLADKKLLSEVGDSVLQARVNSIDSVGYNEQQVLYKLENVNGYDSVLIYSVHPDSAIYRAVFTQVGPNEGNYIFDRFTAVGRVYKWVEPIAGIPQGNFIPAQLLLSPKRRRMISSGVNYRFAENFVLTTEVSTTNNDQNTFSRKDKNNDNAFGNRTRLTGEIKLGKTDSSLWSFITDTEIEYRTAFFSEIERYRTVEFDRDWNIRDKTFVGQQFLAQTEASFKHKQKGNISTQAQSFNLGSAYAGRRACFSGNWRGENGFSANWESSYLNAKTITEQNTYLRHKIDINQNLGFIKVGFVDDHELNQFVTSDILFTNSYQWYDWKAYIKQGDSVANGFSLFYRERYDNKSDSLRLKSAAIAKHFGASYDWISNKFIKLNVLGSYRTLEIKDSTLINQTPENTVIGRADYSLKLWKGALTNTTFYEIGSGLELRKEFLYFQVNSGQGVYTWIDYNGDGVKDLNEFEVAQFADQADYIRIFTPSNEYVKTFSNEFNQSIFWKPERIWSNKTGVLNVLARFSNQTRFRITRKTGEAVVENYNPFRGEIADTSLISSSSSIRNTLFFNRINAIFGLDYVFQNAASKTLLANGFDARNTAFNQVNLRWNIAKKFTLKATLENGNKEVLADYTSGRNYAISYLEAIPSFIYQPSTNFRVSVEGRFTTKENSVEFGGENTNLTDLGVLFKYNQAEKGSLLGGFNAINIQFDGAENNAVAFEMLESLRPGINYTWNLGYQRTISKSLQLSLQYYGRKSEGNRTIHAGGLEVRAFF